MAPMIEELAAKAVPVPKRQMRHAIDPAARQRRKLE
jgi:hypothetical protein